jgi:hypothetical protein
MTEIEVSLLPEAFGLAKHGQPFVTGPLALDSDTRRIRYREILASGVPSGRWFVRQLPTHEDRIHGNHPAIASSDHPNARAARYVEPRESGRDLP